MSNPHPDAEFFRRRAGTAGLVGAAEAPAPHQRSPHAGRASV